MEHGIGAVVSMIRCRTYSMYRVRKSKTLFAYCWASISFNIASIQYYSVMQRHTKHYTFSSNLFQKTANKTDFMLNVNFFPIFFSARFVHIGYAYIDDLNAHDYLYIYASHFFFKSNTRKHYTHRINFVFIVSMNIFSLFLPSSLLDRCFQLTTLDWLVSAFSWFLI